MSLYHRGTGSSGYIEVSRISVIPAVDFGTGIIGDEKPADNATVGGQLGTDVTDESGGSIDDIDALNTLAWSEITGQQYTTADISSGRIIISGSSQGFPAGGSVSPNVEAVVGSIRLVRYGDCRFSCGITVGGPTDLSGHTYTVRIYRNAVLESASSYNGVVKGDSIAFDKIALDVEPDDLIEIRFISNAYGGGWDGVFNRDSFGLYADGYHTEELN